MSAWRSWRIRRSCAALEKFGTVELWRNDAGLTSTQLAVQQAAAGYKVWRDYDGSDGLRQYMYDLEAANEDILDLEVIGHTYGTDPEGDGPDTPREIIALRLSANDVEGERDDGSKPAVLYSSTIHAREWIATEVNRRLLEWFIKGWREEKPDVVNILNTTELWFVLVAEPRRLPVHVRRRPAVAEEPARQRRRRRDHAASTASTPTATSRSTGTTTTRVRARSPRTRPTAAPRRAPSPRPGRSGTC